jgi:hypothetical protein
MISCQLLVYLVGLIQYFLFDAEELGRRNAARQRRSGSAVSKRKSVMWVTQVLKTDVSSFLDGICFDFEGNT